MADLIPVKHRFPPQHFLIYGRAFVGKSRLLTTFPKPIIVFQFDAFGKDLQYLRFGGTSYTDLYQTDVSAKQDGSYTIPTRDVLSAKGNVAMRIHYFHDSEWVVGEQRYYAGGDGAGWKVEKGVGVPRPRAYPSFLTMMGLFTEAEAMKWGTVALDSVTSMADAARTWSEYTMNPFSKEPRQHHGFATDRLKQMLCGKWAGFPTNVVLLAHINSQRKDEVDAEMLHMLAAPGQLATADGLPSRYSEFYRMYSVRDKETKELTRWLQTEKTGAYNAGTSVDAPNPSPPDYRALWSNFNGQQ